MRLRTATRALRFATAFACFVVGLTLTLRLGTSRWLVTPPELVGALALLWGARLALVLAARARLERAFAAGDAPALRRHMADYQEWPPEARLWQARALMLEERWSEARRLLMRCRPSRIVEDHIAWCMAHDGEAEAAVALASSPVTRGVALLRADRPHEAAAQLGGVDGACAAFHQGEALHSIGREDEARLAWARAAADHGDGKWARKARERLGPDRAGPYRS